ncbi:Ent-kaurenoic acid oxidase 1 isoform X1, partial [Tanacetum coccineum]
MAPATRSSTNQTDPDPIAAQLAAIAARLESMETLKEDVAALKSHVETRGKSYNDNHGESSWRSQHQHHRFGPNGVYKSFMFGKPSIIVTVPEACRKVMCDDEAFQPGWPISTLELIGRKSFVSIGYEDHKRLRKITASPVNGHEALSVYMRYIETNVVETLDKWSKMGRIEFLTQLRKLTFKIIMHIFLSSEGESVREALEKEYTTLNYGVRAQAINLPGFVYHKALKARKNLVAILQAIVTERRKIREETKGMAKQDMLDNLLDTRDDHGIKLTDEEIID